MIAFPLVCSSLAVHHMRGQWAPRPDAGPVQQCLPELQPERGGGERGPPEGHPDLEGASHRHLQVGMGEGEGKGQIHPPEEDWGPAVGCMPAVLGCPGRPRLRGHRLWPTLECKGWSWGDLG